MFHQVVSERRKSNPGAVRKPSDVYSLLKSYWKAEKEHFILITLNGIHEPISLSIVSIGLVNRTIVHPREIFTRAIKDMASSIIICHNHPSGSVEASAEDKSITERICKAGELIGIKVLDHVIFSKYGYASLREEGYFDTNGDETAQLE